MSKNPKFMALGRRLGRILASFREFGGFVSCVSVCSRDL